MGSHVNAYVRICPSHYALILHTFILMMRSIKVTNNQRCKRLQGHRQTVKYQGRKIPSSLWTSATLTPCDMCLFGGLRSYGGGSGEKGDSGELWKGTRLHCRTADRVTKKVVSVHVWVCVFCNVWVFW